MKYTIKRKRDGKVFTGEAEDNDKAFAKIDRTAYAEGRYGDYIFDYQPMTIPVFLITIALLSGLAIWAISKNHIIVSLIFVVMLIGFVRYLWRM